MRFVNMGCIVALSMLSAGCTGYQPMTPDQESREVQRRTDYVLRELRTEAATLREEMAATRIRAAKQKAELQELQRQLPLLLQESAEFRKADTELRRGRADQQQALDAKQTELAALRSERDQLRQMKLELQTQAVQLPPLQQALAEARAVEGTMQGRVKELEASVASLTGELEQVRKGLAGNRSKSTAKPGKPASAKRSPPPAKSEATSDRAPSPKAKPASRLISAPASQDRPGHHIVEPGDTLGTLARQYDVTAEELKTANKLQSDVIRVGQRLTIPAAGLPSLHLSP